MWENLLGAFDDMAVTLFDRRPPDGIRGRHRVRDSEVGRPGPRGGGPGLLTPESFVDDVMPDGGEFVASSVGVEGRPKSPDVDGLFHSPLEPLRLDSEDLRTVLYGLYTNPSLCH